jgi:group I intron endonuclease
MAKSYSVYLITNTVNGKVYVGKAANPKTRWYSHTHNARRGGTATLQKAIRKYGAGAFTMEILATCASDSEALARERVEIATRKTRLYHIGYNSTDGGEGPSGAVVSDETRRRMSEAGKRRPGRIPTAEERARISATLTGRKNGPLTEEHKAKLRAKRLGMKFSADVRAKMSAGILTKGRSEKQRANSVRFGKAWLGKKRSAETRRKMSENAKKRWAAHGAEGFALARKSSSEK